ncbi:MAG: glycosyl transferase family protein [Sphingomonadaceae bacterium]
MELFGFTALQWLVLVKHELLLFAAIFFLAGAADDIAVDLAWLWLRLTGRGADLRVDRGLEDNRTLAGRAAVFIPAWDEPQVIGTTIRHMLSVWPQDGLRLYLGCYSNDMATLEAAHRAAGGDPRLRIVIHDAEGPTTKADCLNRLYRALEQDEVRLGERFRMVLLHDAEDMVDPAALPLLDRAIESADMVQLPVMALPQPRSRWIGSHYVEEFAEQHGKALVVRDALGAGVPLAGVGCAIARPALASLPRLRGDAGPFAADCLTEDYELGLLVSANGGRSRFLRARTSDGRLIATRAWFPARLDQAVRQKTRWIHGIAFQGWDRLGWRAHAGDLWMRMRDRRGPFTALVLALAYLLLLLSAVVWGLSLAGLGQAMPLSPMLETVLWLNFASLLWRLIMRFAFTAREFGVGEGLRAILRIPVGNVIAIMAGRRAVAAYIRTLTGAPLQWDKTEHLTHPASTRAMMAGGA